MTLQKRIAIARAAIEHLEADLRASAHSSREEDLARAVTESEKEDERAWNFLENAADQAIELLQLLLSLRGHVASARLRGFEEAEEGKPEKEEAKEEEARG